jgi:endonuclease
VEGQHQRPYHSDEVARENALQAKIVTNPILIEPGLQLLGQYYQVGRRYLDILFRDSRGDFLVVELKLSRGDYHAAGQLAHYMGLVNEHLAKNEGKAVRGIVMARHINPDLKLAISMIRNAAWLECD